MSGEDANELINAIAATVSSKPHQNGDAVQSTAPIGAATLVHTRVDDEQQVDEEQKKRSGVEMTHLSIHSSNLITECVLNAHLLHVATHAHRYGQYADRYYRRHQRGCVYIQFFTLQDAVDKKQRLLMGLSRADLANLPNSAPVKALVDSYDPQTQFVCLVSINTDKEERAWLASACINKQTRSLFKWPVYERDCVVFSYNPSYVVNYEQSLEEAGRRYQEALANADTDEERQRLEAARVEDYLQPAERELFAKHKRLDAQVGEYIKENATPAVSVNEWPFTSHEVFRTRYVLQGERNAFGLEHGGMELFDFEQLMRKIDAQPLLLNCQADPCSRLETEEDQFARNECPTCRGVVYCSNACLKRDRKVHKKECAQVRRFREQHTEGTNAAAYAQTAEIEF